MKVLFIGGTGVISSACSRLCLASGMELFLFNRGKTSQLNPGMLQSEGAHIIQGDIYDFNATKEKLQPYQFDVVVDWIAYTPENIENDIRLFKDKTSQFVFISSASAYQKPPIALPITESTPLHNPFWEYSRAKIACEERLMKAYREENFPITVVRPSHTYDKTKLPVRGGYTTIDRMRKGKKVIVHGDGTSLWVLTHHEDFARGFVGLLGNFRAIGETFHITSDELLSWNQIYQILGRTVGVEPDLLHVPSSLIAASDPEIGAGLLGDKAHSVIFDNSKIKSFVPDYCARIPFSRGAAEIIEWYDADPSRQVIDEKYNQLLDHFIDVFENIF